jgi:hypothetical protein
VNITNNILACNKNNVRSSFTRCNIVIYFCNKATATLLNTSLSSLFNSSSSANINTNSVANHNLNLLLNNNLDISDDIVNLKDGTANLQFWGFTTSIQRDLHQSLKCCNPRFQGRGDNSVYNRPFIGLKTIMAVVGGFVNSLITRVSVNNSIFSTYLGNQNGWSLAIFNCFRPFCFAYKGS